MNKVRRFINTALGSVIAALGITGCGTTSVECMYGVPAEKYGVPPFEDTTVRAMYGVDPIVMDAPVEEEEAK
jgi:hypothetical protein